MILTRASYNSQPERLARMNDVLTIAEIERSFESEWVLLEDPQTSESLQLEGGKVLFHSKDRDEVYRKAITVHPKRFAIHYTGRLPRDAAIVL